MHPQLTRLLAEERIAELHRAAAASQQRRQVNFQPIRVARRRRRRRARVAVLAWGAR